MLGCCAVSCYKNFSAQSDPVLFCASDNKILKIEPELEYSFTLLPAWIHGDPRKVVYPTDSHGQFCGQQGTPNA